MEVTVGGFWQSGKYVKGRKTDRKPKNKHFHGKKYTEINQKKYFQISYSVLP